MRGEELADWVLSSDLHICNKGNDPTFFNSIREEVIDVTLCSSNMVEYIENWHVSKDTKFSDHNRIEFGLIVNMNDNDLKGGVYLESNFLYC